MANYSHNLVKNPRSKMINKLWGNMDGENVHLIEVDFSAEGGLLFGVSNFGGLIQYLKVKGKDGLYRDIILGYEDLKGYQKDVFYMGKVIGPYANRVINGRYTWKEGAYQLSQNEGSNHLHGGFFGLDKRIWQIESLEDIGRSIRVVMKTSIAEGEEGYPSNMSFQLEYLISSHQISLNINAFSEKDCPVNLTFHPYFHLEGVDSGTSILDHSLEIQSNTFFPIDETYQPAPPAEVSLGDSFDFRLARSIREAMAAKHVQLQICQGYDHCFIVSPKHPIRLSAPGSGICLEIEHNQEGVQVYTPARIPGFEGVFPAICLEPQYFPNGPNLDQAEKAFLLGGEQKTWQSIYSFNNSSHQPK